MKLTIATILLLTSSLYAQNNEVDPAAKLAKTYAASALKKYEGDLQQAKLAYEKLITEARKAYLMKLEDALAKELQRGADGLDNALVIRKEIKRLKSESSKGNSRVTDMLALLRVAVAQDPSWKFFGNSLAANHLTNESALDIPYQPTGDYDLTVKLQLVNQNHANDTFISLPHGGKLYPFAVRHKSDGTVQLSFLPIMEARREKFGKPPMGITLDRRFTFTKQRTLVFKVRTSGIEVFLDGKSLFHISKDEPIKTEIGNFIQLNSYYNRVMFEQISLKDHIRDAKNSP